MIFGSGCSLLVFKVNWQEPRAENRLPDIKCFLSSSTNGQNKVIIITTLATTEIHNTFLENLEVTVYFPKELGILFKHPGDNVIKEVLKLE